jgi:hypothetical protein
VSTVLLGVFHAIHYSTGAKFNYQLSTFNDKNFGKNNFAIRKVIAINAYLKEYYLRQIKDASTDILYSIVISKDESINRPRYAFFDATFHSMHASFVRPRYSPVPDYSYFSSLFQRRDYAP